ncbi:MAG: DNA cytosine methyltransferase [Defluviitaleaceae bacterium]|nr:DNA cytosine methyltransferase [Defluviitaleaceae bacterium]MCL2263858.1 DNA cytosine methyltransferase [Defluviitaleaceae bacterium]
MITTVGSVCSGIEAASVAWNPLGLQFEWFSEIAAFPCRVLKEKYPNIPNSGDMINIPEKITRGEISAPDIICGGTPCQAFSYAGWKSGLNDERGNLTLKFVDIINANDDVRTKNNQSETIVFWENVEGVLTDKTNAFGCFISSLAGLDEVVNPGRWPSAGLLRGRKRNVAWRVLDAKYFGLPQQRRRLYLLAGGLDFHPQEILFEKYTGSLSEYPPTPLTFKKDGSSFEIFREYTDCVYAAYGTKWNGNAAANNGSLFVVQDGRIRRFSPLECERLMGFPDNYTDLAGAKKTQRYQAIGNSWAVPVVRWIGERLLQCNTKTIAQNDFCAIDCIPIDNDCKLWNLGKDIIAMDTYTKLNCSPIPEKAIFGRLSDIVSPNAIESIYITPVGCHGIVRRKNERNTKLNNRLEEVLLSISSEMSSEEIEKRSRIQQRGRFSA